MGVNAPCEPEDRLVLSPSAVERPTGPRTRDQRVDGSMELLCGYSTRHSFLPEDVFRHSHEHQL